LPAIYRWFEKEQVKDRDKEKAEALEALS